jgi:two-component system chemotaxis sensor kinase CheA
MDLSRFYNQFREETSENIRLFTDGMLLLEKDTSLSSPGTREQLDAVFRAMHTIKGSARLLGFGAIGRLAHTMENILGAVREGSHSLDRGLIDDMLKSGDALLDMTMVAVEGGSTNVNVDQLIDTLNRSLEAGKSEPPPPPTEASGEESGSQPAEAQTQEDKEAEALKAKIRARKARIREQRQAKTAETAPPAETSDGATEAKSDDRPPEPPPPPDEANVHKAASDEEEEEGEDEDKHPVAAPAPAQQPGVPARKASPSSKTQTVRVRVDRLDTLINLTGELVVGKQIQTEHVQALYELNTLVQQQEHELLALDAIVRELRISADKRQSMQQHINVLLNSGDQARRVLRTQVEQFSRHVDQQGLLVNDLEQEVMAARMLPVSNVFATLPRAVRELSNTTGKDVNLVIRGENTELDRKLLEALNDPLLHLIRNAIDHGIESPDERVGASKPRQGLVEVVAEATGGEVHITIRDDGRGMHPQKLRDIATRKGLISKENAALLSEQEALELIFLPGFSSASMITDISGRGVGMDVVRTNINELGGQVTIDSEVGKGTSITIILPLTIVTTRILLINVGVYTFALPASGCHGIVWAHQDHIQTIEGRATIAHEGQTIPLLHMADLMGIEAEPPFTNSHREPAILVGSSQRLMSLIVSKLLDEREAVVKPLGPIFEQQRRYSGAVQLGNGQLVLMLNPVSLVQSARGIAQTRPSVSSGVLPQRRPQLLIAEDSFTTRELIRSILQSAGYDVTAAIDGQDALDKLRVKPYDLVVTDVEMPRVDGFELTSRIRQELDNHETPVVIITSLASDEYRQRGMEAGAQAYIVKSQFNQDNLLNVIQQLLGHEIAG